MNGTGMTPPYGTDGGIGSSAKAFLLLVILFLLFLMFGSSSFAGVNLTNNGSTTASTGANSSTVDGQQVIAIQGNTTNTTSGAGQVPVTGGCSDPYTVQAGDTLSQIAANCNTTLATIRTLNPEITNANLIYPGQQLRISNGATQPAQVFSPTQVPVTGGADTTTSGQPQVGVALPTAQASLTGLPVLRAGSSLQVKAINFPANTPVTVAIGPKDSGYNVAAAGITDATGTVISNITVPVASNPITPWVVVVVTSGQPMVQGTSQPFYITAQ